MGGYKPTGQHPEKKLTAAAVRNLGPGFYSDGHGLHLKVDRSGAKRWIQRIVIQGKRRDIGLGSASLVSLVEAREAALEHRKQARLGDDPLAAKRRSKAILTFEAAARKVHELRKPTWKNAKHADQWISTLENYCFQIIGDKSVGDVDSHDVSIVVEPLWTKRPETARRVLQRIGTVLQWAKGKGWRTDDPTQGVRQTLPRHDKSNKRHHPALPHREVASSLAKISASRALPATKLAFKLLIHTAARSGEVREATWDEIDLPNAVWTIPPDRMKTRVRHRVPLTAVTIAILREAEALRQEGSDLVFPSARGKALSDMTLSKLMKELGLAAVPHGYRSSFRDWAGETTNHPHQAIEFALSHLIGNKAEAAYARSDLLERRKKLMEDWDTYLAKIVVKTGS